MCLLVESIKVQYRIPKNLEYHSARMNSSRQVMFGIREKIDLERILTLPQNLGEGIYKCRVIYGASILEQHYIPYIPRKIRSLQLVQNDQIEYSHKYLDRSQLELLRNKIVADEVLIVKNQRPTDTFSANVVFYDGISWITPSKPLLKGTKRQYLLDKNIILEKDIFVQDIKHFHTCALINAMCDLDESNTISVDQIIES